MVTESVPLWFYQILSAPFNYLYSSMSENYDGTVNEPTTLCTFIEYSENVPGSNNSTVILSKSYWVCYLKFVCVVK